MKIYKRHFIISSLTLAVIFLSCSFLFPAVEALAATTYTITATSGTGGTLGTGGTIAPSGSVVVNSNASSTFIIAPASGYSIEDVYVDNIPKGAVTTYTFTNVTANHTIFALFLTDVGADGTSPTGRNPRLFWTPEKQVLWHQMAMQNHPLWQMGQANAYYAVFKTEQDNPLYGGIETGQWEALDYQITGDVAYARAAITLALNELPVISQGAGCGGIADPTLSQFADTVWEFDWLYPAMTDSERQQYLDGLYNWVDAVKGFDNATYNDCATRMSDSDDDTSHYFGIMDVYLATKGLDPRADNLMDETFLNGMVAIKPIGGLVSTGANDNTTMRNSLSFFAKQSQGGVWLESNMYNQETMRIILMGIEAARTATGTDYFPELTQWAKDAALLWPYLVSPGTTSIGVTPSAPAQWGDEEHAYSLASYYRGQVAAMLAGYTKDDPNTGPYINKWISDYAAKYSWLGRGAGPNGYYGAATAFDNQSTTQPLQSGWMIFLLGYDPNAPMADYKEKPTTYASPGMGFSYDLSSWNDNASYFVEQNNNPSRVDHMVQYNTDPILWRKGWWVLDHIVGYDSSEPTLTNGAYTAGVGSMDEAVGQTAQEFGPNNSYDYSSHSTGGAYYDYYTQPPTFDNETTTKTFYLPGSDNVPDTIIMYYRINAVPPTNLSGYSYGKAGVPVEARLQSSPTKEIMYHAKDNMPTVSGDTIKWQTKNNQTVNIQTLSSSDVNYTIEKESQSLYWGYPYSIGTNDYRVRIVPSVDQKWDTFVNVINAYDTDVDYTNTRVVSQAGEAEGVLVSRPNTTDTLVMFNAQQGMDVPTPINHGTYDPTLFSKLAAEQILHSGFNFSAVPTTPTSDVYVADLDTSHQWQVSIDNATPQAITVSSAGMGHFPVSGTGSHSFQLSVAGSVTTTIYNITASSDSNGAITPSGSTTVNSGDSQTYTITPNANYKIADVQVDGSSIGVTGAYTFNNVTTNHTISATFASSSAPVCTDFTYSSWSACKSNSTETRTITSSAPQDCAGGGPILSQSCTYVPSINPCTDFTYSDWSACQSDNTQTRTVSTQSPDNCTDGSPSLSQSCTYTPPTTNVVTGGGSSYSPPAINSGGGGNGGGNATITTPSIADLLAKIAQLKSQIAALLAQRSAQTSITKIPKTFSFTTNLKYGQNSTDVKYLQILLNQDKDTTVATTSWGSAGYESIHFGLSTKQAVIKFQQKYNIRNSDGSPLTTGSGAVGPATRVKLNQLLGR